jgi:peptidoglycan-associated lipoprotein
MFLLLALLGCPKQAPVTDNHHVELETPDVPKKSDPVVDEIKANFSRVNFDFDSDRVTNPELLTANAKLLSQHPDIRIEVQGHADDRGTSEYNLALGERRAAAIVNALSSQGIPKTRLATVSYGEERPIASGDGETVWAENRRAEFRVLTGSGVSGTVQ